MGKEGGPSNDAAALDDTFEALLRESAQASGPRSSPSPPQLRADTVLLAGRLRVVRRIGEGGMGVVYEAYDAQRKGGVALKTLSHLDAANVYRLKNEFRSLADLSHPNICQLRELFSEAGQWFFTMELVDGERFDQWVRPSGALHEARLRAALAQLGAAVGAIHAAGKLHRDLKPSNVLVTEAGRVVVLDFGLTVDPELGGVGQTVMDECVSGTPTYMAPEQAAGRPATAASDFYAFGVMLFEALTGQLPFSGHVGEMLAAKQTRDAPRASALTHGLPADLDALCSELLAREPEMRPGEAALRIRLGMDDAGSTDSGSRLVRGSAAAHRSPPSDADGGTQELLGRELELVALRSAFAATQADQPVVLFVSGESGMGKSALCTEFLNELRLQGRATVLSGRCYERENVPFKGFDALVDDLSRHLRRLPALEAPALLPREVFALARIFPVLDRIPAVAGAPKKEIPDPHDLKRRAFDAFAELLARMRDRTPLALWLDDVQWLDQDSVRFMRALLVHPEPVPLLLICAHRSEGAEENALLQAVLQGARDNAKLDVRELRVGPLPRAALCALAQRLLPADAETGAADALAAEAQGSPFFAAELAHAARVRDVAGPPPTLSEALSLHVSALPRGAQQILSLLALAGQPLDAEVAIDAARVADGYESLDRLRAEKLVRVSIDAAGTRSVECYHDKIREHLAAALESLQAREPALALARALDSVPARDAELIARMLDLAGLHAEAAVHSARAAEAAFAALAFERAAQLYGRAIEHGRFEPARLQALRLGRAEALAHAGRAEAAEAYLDAAERATGELALDLEVKASEQYLLRGDLERGRKLLDRALRRIGHALPQNLPAAIASVVWSRARLKLRGLSFTPQAAHDASALRELELLRTSVNGLVRADMLRAADFSARYLRRALDAGHAVEAARALAWEALFRSTTAADAEVDAALAQCAELCQRTGDRLAQSRLWYCRGIDSMARRGRFEEGLADFDQMLALLASEALPGAGHDRAWVHSFRAGCLWGLGRVAEAGELAGAQLEDALARGDHAVSGGLMQVYCVGLMAAGRIEQAERVLEDALARLRWSEITLLDVYWLSTRWLVGAYAGRALETWTETADHRVRFFDSWQGRVLYAGTVLPGAAGMAVSATRSASNPEQRQALEREARRWLRRAGKARPTVFAQIPVDGMQACLHGDRDRAIAILRRSIPPPGSPLLTYILRRRLGELLCDDEGAALISEADAFLRAGGSVDPARFSAAITPGLALVER